MLIIYTFLASNVSIVYADVYAYVYADVSLNQVSKFVYIKLEDIISASLKEL